MTGLRVGTDRVVHIYRSEGHEVAALAGVDFDVAPGEMVGLLGPSGAGKSTLLNLLAGLFRPSAGRIRLSGPELGTLELTAATSADLDLLRGGEVSLLLQGAPRNLLPYASALDNVRFAQRTARRAGRSLPDPARKLARVGLAADLHAAALGSLTPGQLQLTALAVATATDPGLLLADEPTSQLDHAARDRVLQALRDLNAAIGTTVVLVTHDPEVAASLPRTVTIRDGRVGGEGRSGEEYAVVTPDGFLPLPGHVRDDLAPGTLVRFHRTEAGGYELEVADE